MSETFLKCKEIMNISDEDLKKFPDAPDFGSFDEEMSLNVNFEKDAKAYMSKILKEIEKKEEEF